MTIKFKLTPIKTEDDFMEAFPLLRQLIAIENPESKTTKSTSWRQYQKAMKESYFLYAAKTSAEIVALVGIRILNDPFDTKPYAIINNLVVEEDYRGMGIGTDVLEQAEKIAKKNKASSVIVHVLKSNKKAKKLYQSLDLTPIADLMYKEL